jgi:hypothetical protein
VKAQFEVTDTFGGEANYAWAHRGNLDLPENITDRAIVRRLKAFAGFTGLRCEVFSSGDYISVRPIGRSAPCQIAFFSIEEQLP